MPLQKGNFEKLGIFGFFETFSEVNMEQNCVEGMALSITDYTINQVVQATHHQVDIWYGASRAIQCSCMSLISVSCTLFNFPDKFNLDSKLSEGDQLIKLIAKLRYLRMEDLPQEFLIKNFSLNAEILKNESREIENGAYLLSCAEILFD